MTAAASHAVLGLDPTPVLAAVVGAPMAALIALAGGQLLERWRARNNAPLAKAELTSKEVSTLSVVVDQLQEENARHLASLKTLREDAHRVRNQLAKVQSWARLMLRHLERLEALILSLGGEAPARPELPELDV